MHSFSVSLPNLPLGCTLPSDVEELLLASAKPVLILANKLRLRFVLHCDYRISFFCSLDHTNASCPACLMMCSAKGLIHTLWCQPYLQSCSHIFNLSSLSECCDRAVAAASVCRKLHCYFLEPTWTTVEPERDAILTCFNVMYEHVSLCLIC